MTLSTCFNNNNNATGERGGVRFSGIINRSNLPLLLNTSHKKTVLCSLSLFMNGMARDTCYDESVGSARDACSDAVTGVVVLFLRCPSAVL